MRPRIHPVDIAIAAIVLVLGQLEAWAGIGAMTMPGPDWARGLAYGLAAVLLVFRRARPLAVLTAVAIVLLAEFALAGAPEGYALLLAPLVAIYTVGRWVAMPTSLWGILVGTVLWAGWAWTDPLNTTLEDRLFALVWLAPWVIAWLVGALVRTTATLREQRRAERAARESRAIAEERNRIARELHDVVGHGLSVMTVQAAAVRRRLRPDQATERTALEAVEAVGRESLAEMRRLVGVLRTDEAASREPPPGLGTVGRVADRVTAAGLPVTVTTTGAARDLPIALDIAAFRVVQEGLTNAMRHATGATRVDVDVDFGDRALSLRVRDDGVGPIDTGGFGAGLTGLRERVTLHEGDLSFGPGPDGGCELRAELPWPAA
ncbi:hypothetical protein ARHIZOSPH14_12680 [Agromyces rhizosphaerae]|uniref:histidine kinase n=1 Tax=Agromyces rhizosphaerae TaxID=88374 RepID=A0A9W6CQJ5_9MICO|nr:sensor histidine kinase [Agromyces rhizosphaerae]GLI27026.1 hypothetical protein ARHIZOSPH14_12680 [Agromyces rhizosphaerae]